MLNSIKRIFTLTDANYIKYRAEAEEKAEFTPDLAELQERTAHNVFIYGECQRGAPHHDKLGTSPEYRGLSYTESSDFVMYKKELGKETFPFAMPVTDDQKVGMTTLVGDPGQIMGEVFTISTAGIISLDNHMLNTVTFERKRVNVLIPFKDAPEKELQLYKTEVWMYCGKLDFWKDQVNNQETRKLFTKSPRLFCSKENNKNNEPLGAYYVFDYKLETNSK